GEGGGKGGRGGGGEAADEAMLQGMAHTSMEQLAAFLTSPDVAPGALPPAAEAQVAMDGPHEASPEAAGIFRISRPQADPISTDAVETGAVDDTPAPVPPRRPHTPSAGLERATGTAAAS